MTSSGTLQNTVKRKTGLTASRGFFDLVPLVTTARLSRAEVQRLLGATGESRRLVVFCTQPG